MDPNTPDQEPGTPTAPTGPSAAPGPPSHSGLRRALTMAFIVVLLVAAGLLIYSTATSHPGIVVFSTDLPVAGSLSAAVAPLLDLPPEKTADNSATGRKPEEKKKGKLLGIFPKP